jgi:hypothetical protein
VLSEDQPDVCENGIDDDGDGATDCDDASCDASGACEVSITFCQDGDDNDGDALVDCADDDCRAGGFCESIVTSCTLRPQSGCPSGMGCYRRAIGSTSIELRCRSSGIGRSGSTCSLDAIDALAPNDPHPCAAGHGCGAIFDEGMCGAYCASDADCPTGGLCLPPSSLTGTPGVCTAPCDPRLLGACPGDLACVSYHERGEPFATGGARFACVDAALVRGTAVVGAPCLDPPVPSTPASQVCVSSAACVPNTAGGGATCRALCDVAAPSCATGACMPLYETGTVSGVGNVRFGACL